MNRPQAKRCTQKELAYLSYWRRNGYVLGIDDPIPLSTITKPSIATRRPVIYVLACILVIAVALSFGFAWLGKAAGIF